MESDTEQSLDIKKTVRFGKASAVRSGRTETRAASSVEIDTLDTRLDEALETTAHGATVSIFAFLVQKGLSIAFTIALTTGFGASVYGLYAISNRLQKFLLSLTMSFKSGINRFLPNASPEEQNALTTFAGIVWLSVGTGFGIGLFAIAPIITEYAGHGSEFQLFVQLFALGLPVSVWLHTIVTIFRAFEQVGGYNLLLRVAVPLTHLILAGVGAFVFHDIVLVIVGIILSMGLIGVIGAIWLIRVKGLRPRFHGVVGSEIRKRYVSFSLPLFVNGFATTTQQLGYYPLIILYLTETAGGVFAIGILIGSIVQLPIIGINEFLPPVAAALHEDNHHKTQHLLYQVTSRLALIGILALSIPIVIFRTSVMSLFGPTFTSFAPLLPGFIIGQVGAGSAGSNGILLRMMDHHRAFLIVNVAVTILLITIAVPLTVTFGLPGLVGSYLVMLLINNSLQVAVLYYLEGMQPFTRLHVKPLVAAVPLLLVTRGSRELLPGPTAVIVGSSLGITVYVGFLYIMGFTNIERRLLRTLLERYKNFFNSFGSSLSYSQSTWTYNKLFNVGGVVLIVVGGIHALTVSGIPNHLAGLFTIFAGTCLLVIADIDYAFGG